MNLTPKSRGWVILALIVVALVSFGCQGKFSFVFWALLLLAARQIVTLISDLRRFSDLEEHVDIPDVSMIIVEKVSWKDKEKLQEKGSQTERLLEAQGAGNFIGAVERIIFFFAIAFSVPIIVGIWVAFKVASKWAEWKDIVQVNKDIEDLSQRRILGNYLFNRFIIGTGVNLLMAMALGGFYLLCFDT